MAKGSPPYPHYQFQLGSAHHKAKLTEEDVREIRSLHANGHSSLLQLSEQFGVTKGNISYILSRKTWKHV